MIPDEDIDDIITTTYMYPDVEDTVIPCDFTPNNVVVSNSEEVSSVVTKQTHDLMPFLVIKFSTSTLIMIVFTSNDSTPTSVVGTDIIIIMDSDVSVVDRTSTRSRELIHNRDDDEVIDVEIVDDCVENDTDIVISDHEINIIDGTTIPKFKYKNKNYRWYLRTDVDTISKR